MDTNKHEFWYGTHATADYADETDVQANDKGMTKPKCRIRVIRVIRGFSGPIQRCNDLTF